MIKQVGKVKIKAKHLASCHCGRVLLELDLPNGVVAPSRCNCSICKRKGAITIAVPIADLYVAQGADFLSLYQFKTGTAEHYFCSICGIYTHHKRRSNPNLYSVNLGCLEGVNPYELENVPVGDGINHSSDR